ncbi:hypothetical protein VNI00_012944 [Paramarasmius palmivorus]|uniref:Uncharacterized protein n=1 Tax=Paramarasmius palmivorus TaxID=297713 RepID=A0AAW0C0J8_9AGAR
MTEFLKVLPHRTTLIRMYQRIYYQSKLKHLFDAQWTVISQANPNAEWIKEMNKFTSSMLASETEEVLEALKEEIQKEYDERMTEYRKIGHWDSDAEKFNYNWKKAHRVIPTLTDSIAAFLGCGVLLTTFGPMADGEISVQSVCAVVPEARTRQTLAQFDRAKLAETHALCHQYAQALFSESTCRSRIPESGADLGVDEEDTGEAVGAERLISFPESASAAYTAAHEALLAKLALSESDSSKSDAANEHVANAPVNVTNVATSSSTVNAAVTSTPSSTAATSTPTTAATSTPPPTSTNPSIEDTGASNAFAPTGLTFTNSTLVPTPVVPSQSGSTATTGPIQDQPTFDQPTFDQPNFDQPTFDFQAFEEMFNKLDTSEWDSMMNFQLGTIDPPQNVSNLQDTPVQDLYVVPRPDDPPVNQANLRPLVDPNPEHTASDHSTPPVIDHPNSGTDPSSYEENIPTTPDPTNPPPVEDHVTALTPARKRKLAIAREKATKAAEVSQGEANNQTVLTEKAAKANAKRRATLARKKAEAAAAAEALGDDDGGSRSKRARVLPAALAAGGYKPPAKGKR